MKKTIKQTIINKQNNLIISMINLINNQDETAVTQWDTYRCWTLSFNIWSFSHLKTFWTKPLQIYSCNHTKAHIQKVVYLVHFCATSNARLSHLHTSYSITVFFSVFTGLSLMKLNQSLSYRLNLNKAQWDNA